MKDFCILHLSDLHIKNCNSAYSTALKNLIDDITTQLEAYHNVVLVISGDIIDKGDYDGSEIVVVKFFTDLSLKIKGKVVDIQVVPGNHDIERTIEHNLIAEAHKTKGIDAASGEEWKLHREAYNKFLNLVNKIYRIFGKDKLISNTFGVDEPALINGVNVCFIRFDTAWCSIDSNVDNRNLRIGNYQLQKVKNDYLQHRNAGLPIDITIAISHHPLNWLTVEEEDEVNNYMLDNDFLNVDLLLCGHIHNRFVVNYYNHQHSLMTLVTGIGWGGNKPTDSKEEYRYSIYVINSMNNCCEIIMRRTQSNMMFDYDYSVYTDKEERVSNKLFYPVKVKEWNSFIPISTPAAELSKKIFTDSPLLEKIKEVSMFISTFREEVSKIIDSYTRNYLQLIKDDCAIYTRIEDFMYASAELEDFELDEWFNNDDTLSYFSAFLQDICDSFIGHFEDSFDAGAIRCHFRWYDSELDCYNRLCQSFSLSPAGVDEPVKSIPWGGMVEKAFESRKPLIYTANPQFSGRLDYWDDYITIIPRFYKYIFTKRIRKKTEDRPILTFGLCLRYQDNNLTPTIILGILDYLQIDQHITDVIDEFVRLFNINSELYIKYIRNLADKVNV